MQNVCGRTKTINRLGNGWARMADFSAQCALAPQRAPTSPDVPTTAEVGMPDLLIENWYGMIAPAATPEKIVATLNRITNEAMRDPQVKQKLADQGLTVAGDTPEQFREFIDAETRKWADVIRNAGVETTK